VGDPFLSPTSAVALSPSADAFLTALRDDALGAADVAGDGALRGPTQIELEQRIGMSRPSIVNLIEKFGDVLLPQSRGGPVALDPDAGVAVAVRISDRRVNVAISDLVGRIKHSNHPEHRELNDDEAVRNADAALDWTVNAIKEQLREHDRTHEHVAGVGIALAAPVDRGTGLIRGAGATSSPVDADWEDWQLLSARVQLQRRLGWHNVPFLVDNDANLGALAEHTWGAARQPNGARYQHLIYVKWSRGIGAGLILNDTLYRGRGIAGEIGHTIVGSPPATAGDPQACPRCGRIDCLSAIAGWDAIKRETGIDKLRTALDSARADAGSPARGAFERAADQVAQTLGPLIDALNPQLVVIGGGVGHEGFDVVRSPLLRGLKRYTLRAAYRDVSITGASEFPDDERTEMHGAIGLILRNPDDDPDPLLAFLQRKVAAAKAAAASAR